MITLEQAILFSPSEHHDYPDVFLIDCGLNLGTVTGYNIIPKRRKGKRRATLKLKTWRGISGGAVHYYGKIIIDGVQYVKGTTEYYNTDINVGLLDYEYVLELKRFITDNDISNHPNKWATYYKGELTNCFDSINDLKVLANDIFKLRFDGDWDFYIEDFYSNQKVFEL